jgi:hypothetical protein
MEQDDMAEASNDNHSDQHSVISHQTPEDLRSSARPSPQSRPPGSSDGLETPGSSDC